MTVCDAPGHGALVNLVEMRKTWMKFHDKCSSRGLPQSHSLKNGSSSRSQSWWRQRARNSQISNFLDLKACSFKMKRHCSRIHRVFCGFLNIFQASSHARQSHWVNFHYSSSLKMWGKWKFLLYARFSSENCFLERSMDGKMFITSFSLSCFNFSNELSKEFIARMSMPRAAFVVNIFWRESV